MYERLKMLRRALGLSQAEFGARIFTAQNTLSKWESGVNTPNDASVALICREFGVDEVWLRTGVGEMFRQRTREEEIADFVGRMLTRGTPFQQAFVAVLARTTPEEWAIFERKLRELAAEVQKTDP